MTSDMWVFAGMALMGALHLYCRAVNGANFDRRS
jgi:hypothetical protein